MIASNTTRLLIRHTVSATTRLRAALRQFDPYTVGSILLIALIVAGGLVRQAWPTPTTDNRQPTMIAAAGRGQRAIARPIARAPIASLQFPTAPLPILPTAEPPAAAPEPATAAAPAPAEPAEQQLQIDSAPPAATPWTADPAIVHHADGSTSAEFSVPPGAPRLCTGFGDWRDYDANYASSPACKPVHQ